MKKTISAILLSLVILIFPLRYAYLEDTSNVPALLSFLAVVAGFFTVVFLFNSDEQPTGH